MLAALALVAGACGSSSALPDGPGAPDAGAVHLGTQFAGETAVKVARAGDGWLALLETLQPQLLITSPMRRMVLVDGRLDTVKSFHPLEGWTLIDAAGHPSGEVTALYVRVVPSDPSPLRIQLSRYRADGSRVDTEVPPYAPSGADPGTLFMPSLDRARIAAAGEDVILAARWPGNAVHAYRFGFAGGAFQPSWATRVEPEAEALILGIIGGGFDNFHQGDSEIFVYVDLDAAGNTYVAVAASESVLEKHDAAFGDDLLAGADPGSFDFGTAVLTKLDAEGRRVYAKLLGTPGLQKRLLGMRAGDGSVLLLGRIKTGTAPESWDAWILSASAETGELLHENTVDVDRGDMFWDAVALPAQRILAVGSTSYTQNPSGLSVSDGRAALAVVLDAQGTVLGRLDLPKSDGGRGDEAISVVSAPGGGSLAIGGMLDGPGTHAEVHSNGFLDVRDVGEAVVVSQ